MGGLFDVTAQSYCPRSVVHLEQITDASSKEDVLSLIETAREEAHVQRRRRSLLVDCEPSSFNSWTCERLDLPARGLLSRIICISPRSRTALPPAEA